MNEQVFIGVSVIAFTIGLVQFFKEMFDMSGKPVNAMTMVVGTIVSAWFYTLNSEMISGVWYDISVIVVTGITGGLAAAGYYKLNRDNRAIYYVEDLDDLEDLDDPSEA